MIPDKNLYHTRLDITLELVLHLQPCYKRRHFRNDVQLEINPSKNPFEINFLNIRFAELVFICIQKQHNCCTYSHRIIIKISISFFIPFLYSLNSQSLSSICVTSACLSPFKSTPLLYEFCLIHSDSNSPRPFYWIIKTTGRYSTDKAENKYPIKAAVA